MTGTKRPPLDELVSIFYGEIAVEGVTTGPGNAFGTSFIDAALAGAGAGSYFPMLAILHVGDSRLVDSRETSGFINGTGEVSLASAYKGVAAAIPIGVRYQIRTGKPSSVAVAAILANLLLLMADVGDASASTLGSLYAILGNPPAAQDLATRIGYEGATALAAKLTAARAGYLDNINNAQLLQISAARLGYIDLLADGAVGLAALEALVDDLESRLGTPAVGTVAGDVESIETKVGTNADAAGTTTLFARLRQIVDTYLADATIGLAAIEAYVDLIDDGTNGLAAIKAEVEGLAGAAMRGTDNAMLAASYTAERGTDNAALAADWTNALATALGLDAAPTAVGKLQIKATTIDLNQAAATYDLFTATTQDVVVEKLVIRMSGGALGGAFTYFTIQTDDATPIVLIDATAGAVGNCTDEAQIAWTGAILLDAGTGAKIRLTIAVAQGGAARICDVIAEYRAVVAGGLLS